MKFYYQILLSIFMFFLIGCGGGSNGNTNSGSENNLSVSIYEGIFIDSPVKGLKYKTATQTGLTDEKGGFKYKKNEYISFYLGNIFLGKIKAKKTITPYDLGKSTPDSPSDKTINIAVLLQNCDKNISNKYIDVEDYQNFHFDYVSLDENSDNFINDLQKEGITITVDKNTALRNLNKSIGYDDKNNSNENNKTSNKIVLQIPPISDSQKKEFLDAINEARSHQQDCGEYGVMPAVGPLTWNDKLYKSSYTYNYDMAYGGAWHHIGSNTKYDIVAKNKKLGHGSYMKDRILYYGYKYEKIGENIAKGYKTTKDVVKAWLESDGHCRNIMDPDFKEMGMSLLESNKSDDKYHTYWTIDFGHPR